jgi:histidine kinase
MKPYARISLKNKIFVSILAVILIISVTIALLARWILISGLTKELEQRGIAVAHSIAERGGGLVLDKNYPELLNLIFDEARLRERQHLINYIFVLDRSGQVLSHTFTVPFPTPLSAANPIPEGSLHSVRLVGVGTQTSYDIAVPMNEGLYRIGTVHVGLSKDHIDSLISKLRFAFLGFISGVIVITLLLSSQLTRRITRPVSDLTRLADEISRGNFDIALADASGDWNAKECPAFNNTDLPCWHLDQSREEDHAGEAAHRTCARCAFYDNAPGDEVLQLRNSFRSMIWSIRLYRHRLRESEEKYRSLFDSGPDPVFVIDTDRGTILDANPRAEELYGYGRGELAGMPFSRLAAEGGDDLAAHFREDSDSGCVYRPKVIHVRKDGEPFYVNMHACPISYRSRPAIIIAATDITEMIEKDAQLIQASKMKTLGEMSAGVAHELNQPLNAIKMGTEYLRMVSDGLDIPPEQQLEVLEEMGLQVDRASEIINTLRAFGRQSEIITEKVRLDEPVGAVLSILRRQFELENIRFQLDLAEELPVIHAHSNRLQQIFFNLISNARDAINENCRKLGPQCRRTISIATGFAAGRVFATVEDSGCGIPTDVQHKIFEPFFTTKETGQGMGLGLAITYGIVKDYGGEIRIESREGEGTTFRLEFPAA